MNKVAKLGWKALCTVWPQMAVKIQYKHILGEAIDLKNPMDLNEKINYLKFHADLDEWSRLADKYAVREYVIERGLGEILVPLYGKYDSSADLIKDWRSLPKRFVLKANHGCGEVKLIKDKDSIDKSELEPKLEEWLKEKYGLGTGERHYLKIKPCIIAEQLLEEKNGSIPTDYKIWCFEGKPYCILIITGRDTEEHKKYFRSMYDLNWVKIPDALPHNENYIDADLPKPQNFEMMLDYAAKLSKGHKEVRVDLYNIEGKVYFGEMTFTARGGYNNYSKQLLLNMGSQFEI